MDYLRKDFKNEMDKKAVTIMAMQSEMGATHKMVSTAGLTRGNSRIKGVKQTISRTKDAMMAPVGLPAAWKKIEFILIKQLMAIKERKIRKVFSPNSQ